MIQPGYIYHKRHMRKKKEEKNLALLSYIWYLWLQVPVHHSYIMHVTDSRHQFAHDAAGLCFTEVLLPPDSLQQLSSTEQFQNQECVELDQKNNTEHVSFRDFLV